MRFAILIAAASCFILGISCSSQAPESSVDGYIERLESVDGVLRLITIRTFEGDLRSFRTSATASLAVDIDHLEVHRTTNTPVTLRLQSVGKSSSVVAIDDYEP